MLFIFTRLFGLPWVTKTDLFLKIKRISDENKEEDQLGIIN